MNPAVAGRRISDRSRYFVPQRTAILGGDVNLRANSHAIAFRAHLFQKDPVVRVLGDVVEQFDLPAKYSRITWRP